MGSTEYYFQKALENLLFPTTLKSKKSGVFSGINDIDNMIAPEAGDLMLLSGKAHSGVNYLALQYALYTSINNQGNVAIFPTRSTAEFIAEDLLSILSGIDSVNGRLGRLTAQDKVALKTAADELSGAQIYIEDQSTLSATDIEQTCRRLDFKVEGIWPKLIIIDNFNYLKVTMSPEENISPTEQTLNCLKKVAKDLGAIVLLLHEEGQKDLYSQKCEGLGRLMEVYSDLIIRLIRTPTDTTFNVLKHRRGPTGQIPVTYLLHHKKFSNYSNLTPPIEAIEEL